MCVVPGIADENPWISSQIVHANKAAIGLSIFSLLVYCTLRSAGSNVASHFSSYNWKIIDFVPSLMSIVVHLQMGTHNFRSISALVHPLVIRTTSILVTVTHSMLHHRCFACVANRIRRLFDVSIVSTLKTFEPLHAYLLPCAVASLFSSKSLHASSFSTYLC